LPSTIPLGYEDVPRWEKPFDADGLARVLPRVMRGEAVPARRRAGQRY
jgi:hypothetical protein